MVSLTELTKPLDILIPEGIKKSSQHNLRKSRLIVGSALALLFLLSFILWRHQIIYPFPSLSTLTVILAIMMTVAVYPTLFLTSSTKIAGLLPPIAAIIVVPLCCLSMRGGLSSPAAHWFIIIPPLATFFVSLNVGLAFALISILEIVVIYYLSGVSAADQPAVPGMTYFTLDFFGIVSATLFTTFLSIFFETSRQVAEDTLQVEKSLVEKTLLQLRENEAKVRTAFESSILGVAIVNLSGSFINVNQTFARMLGYEVDDLLRKDFQAITHPDDLAMSVRAADTIVVSDEDQKILEKRYIHRNGSIVLAIIHVQMIRGQDGKPKYFVTQVKDITEQKLMESQLSESEHRFKELAENAPVIIWVSDKEGELSYVNAAWKAFFGEAREASEFMQRVYATDRFRALRSIMRRSGNFQFEIRARDIRGEYRWLRCSGETRFNRLGEFCGHVGTCFDVTEHHKMLDRVRSADAAKSQFVANVSHEIRTPLSIIKGFVDLLDSSDLGREGQHHLDIVRRNAETLNILVNDLLDMSRIESGRVEINNCQNNLIEIMNSIYLGNSLPCQTKGIDFNFFFSGQIPALVTTDATRLKQILNNLINNAISYTNAGSINVEIRYREQELVFTVIDTGDGIEPDDQDHIFDPFVRGKTIEPQPSGTGLGLAISKRLARQLGGDLRLVRSAPRAGAEFELRIGVGIVEPRNLIADANKRFRKFRSNQKAHEKVADLSGVRVLLAEDNQDNQILFAKFLELTGVDLTIVSNGREAVEAVDKESFEVILMDINMPEIDGMEATSILRSKGCRLPVVAVTAHAMKGERQRCLENGFDEYITKPLTATRLIDTVARLAKIDRVSDEALRSGTDEFSSLSGVQDEDDPYAAVFRELLPGFLARLPSYLAEMRASLENRDWLELARTSHSLKGSSAGYGFSNIQELASQIEILAKDGEDNIGRISKHVVELNEIVDQSSKSLLN